jgi:hypothetical protein
MRIDIMQLEFIDLKLRKLVVSIESYLGDEQTITSLYRIGDNGVHGTLPLRGLDLRCKDDELGEKIERYVNSHYVYDPKQPDKNCCLYHNVGRGKHIHLQVHDNTI